VDAAGVNDTNGLSNAELTAILKGLTVRHVLAITDCSYCGALARGIGIGLGHADLRSLVAKRGRVVLTSAGLEPLSPSSGKHSAFADVLLHALKENPGIIDGETLFLQVRDAVTAKSSQTPQYAPLRDAGDSGGGFIFVPQ
jgi:hypothetical protein